MSNELSRLMEMGTNPNSLIDAARSSEYDHAPRAPLSSLQGKDALTDWALKMQDRAVHPLQTAADYSQEFQNLSPVDQAMQMVGGGMAGMVGKVASKVAQKTELELAQQIAGKNTSSLFDTTGLPNRGRDLIQSNAEELADRMRAAGVNVDIQHSGSAVGPSSYLRVVGMPDIRLSGHSKGVFNSGGVLNVSSPLEFDNIVEMATKNQQNYDAQMAKATKEYEESAMKFRINSAQKKLSKGKQLTNSEQEAMAQLQPNKTEYELAHELAQRNASLPVEQGGLGLHPDNTAMDRAKAMGYLTDMPMYHGTSADVDEFNLYHGGDVSRSPVGPAYLIQNPNQLRSPSAAFDPFNSNSANILAGGAAGAVGLGMLSDDSYSQMASDAEARINQIRAKQQPNM